MKNKTLPNCNTKLNLPVKAVLAMSIITLVSYVWSITVWLNDPINGFIVFIEQQLWILGSITSCILITIVLLVMGRRETNDS
jgi:hypothetical protein